MQITFDKEVLAKATKWVVDIVDSKNDTATVRMEVTDTIVTFSSISMYGERSTKVDADIKDAGDETQVFELHAAALKKIPSQATSDSIVFKYDPKKDKTRFQVNGGVRLSVPLVSSADRPIHGSKGMVDVGSLVPADLFNVVRQLSVIPDPSGQLPVFQCLDFETDGEDTLRVLATDGYTFAFQKLTYNAKSDETQHFLLTVGDVKGLQDAKDASSVELYVNDNAVLLEFDDGNTARVNQVKAETPDYSAMIFDERDDETFTFDRKELQTAVTKLGAWNSETNVYMHLDPDAGEITVSSAAGDWSAQIPMKDNTLSSPLDLIFVKNILLKTLRSSERDDLRGRVVRESDNPNELRIVIWDQLKADGEKDEDVYSLNMSNPDEE